MSDLKDKDYIWDNKNLQLKCLGAGNHGMPAIKNYLKKY